MPIYFHIGFPKTGTTSFQKQFFKLFNSKKAKMSYLGKYYNNNNSTYLYNKVTFTSFDKFILYFIKNYNPKNNYFISNEDLIFDLLRMNMFDKKKNEESFNNIYNLINELNKLDEVIVIFFRRNQYELIHSIYSQSYQNYFSQYKSIRNFSSFIDLFLENKGKYLKFDFIENKLNSVCKVISIDYEDLILNDKKTMNLILKSVDNRIKLPPNFKLINENKRKIDSNIKRTDPLNLYSVLSKKLSFINNYKIKYPLQYVGQFLKKIVITKAKNVKLTSSDKNKILKYYKLKK